MKHLMEWRLVVVMSCNKELSAAKYMDKEKEKPEAAIFGDMIGENVNYIWPREINMKYISSTVT